MIKTYYDTNKNTYFPLIIGQFNFDRTWFTIQYIDSPEGKFFKYLIKGKPLPREEFKQIAKSLYLYEKHLGEIL